MVLLNTDEKQLYEWQKKSEDSPTGTDTTMIHVNFTSAEKKWIQMVCTEIQITQHFFVSNAMRLFLHVRENFEEDHFQARQDKLDIYDNIDWLSHAFPYIAPRKTPNEPYTIYMFKSKHGYQPRDEEYVEAVGGDTSGLGEMVKEKFVRPGKRSTYPISSSLVRKVQGWTLYDSREHLTGYYTGVCLLSQWIQSGKDNLGQLDERLRMDPDWDLEAY
jgi:hypothetical protein